jgi:hypothetical protein
VQLIGGPLDGLEVDDLDHQQPVRIPELQATDPVFLTGMLTPDQFNELMSRRVRYHVYMPAFTGNDPVLKFEMTTSWEMVPWRTS